jgi:hypothetical protein
MLVGRKQQRAEHGRFAVDLAIEDRIDERGERVGPGHGRGCGYRQAARLHGVMGCQGHIAALRVARDE